jgi:hypothetical protein
MHAILNFESNTTYTFKKQSFVNITDYQWYSYEAESVNRSQNGSITTLINVIGFLRSSTVELQDSQVAEVHAQDQRLVSVVETATLLY